MPFLICTKVPYGLTVARRGTSNCISLGFVLLACSGGITYSWTEFYSQGVYHGLSAKKIGSCLQEGTQGTGMKTGAGTR